MRRFYSIGLAVILLCMGQIKLNAQNYDIGVFYMPFWQNNIIPDPTNPQYNPWITIPYHIGKGGTQNHTLPTTFCQPSWTLSFNVEDVMRESHWNIMDEYDSYLVNNSISGNWDHYSQLLIPKPIWYADNQDVNGFGFFDSPAYWYNENVRQVTEKQTQLMAQYEIDFAIYNWYWSYGGVDNCSQEPNWLPLWESGQKNWLDPSFNDHGVDLAIFWSGDYSKLIEADEEGVGGNPDGVNGVFGPGLALPQMLDRMAEYMLAEDASQNPRYKIKNGKNVLYIEWEKLYKMMERPDVASHPFFAGHNGGSTPWVSRASYLLDYMNTYLTGETGRGTYFVAVVSERGGSDQVNFNLTWRLNHMINNPIAVGFDAITTYNYKIYDEADQYDWGNGPGDQPSNPDAWESHFNGAYDYGTMKSVYFRFYTYYMNVLPSGTKYQVPVTEGWNKSPMNMRWAGGEFSQYQADPRIWTTRSWLQDKSYNGLKNNQFKTIVWDNANSTPTEYEGALQSAKDVVDLNPTETDNTVILCCWNEHGEGTVIEPTVAWGYEYLEKVKDVFYPTTSGGGGKVIGGGPGGGPIPRIGDPVLPSDSDFIPKVLTIKQNYPNPFKEQTAITYGLPYDGRVQIQIYNSSNQLISTIVNEEKKAGVHEVLWRASGNKQGIYFCQIKHNGQTQTKKMILID